MTLVTTWTASEVRLQPAAASDEPALRVVHALTHCAQLVASLPDPAMAASLTRMQYDAQHAQYRDAYPDSADELIVVADEVVGRCWTDLSAQALRILDIAVVPAHQGRGVATAVMTEQLRLAASAGVPVVLSVWSDNEPARRLYTHLGFAQTAGDANGYVTMTWAPAGPA